MPKTINIIMQIKMPAIKCSPSYINICTYVIKSKYLTISALKFATTSMQ